MNVIKIRERKSVSNVGFDEFPFCEDINKVIESFDDEIQKEKRKIRNRKEATLFEMMLKPCKPRKYCPCKMENCNVMTYNLYCKTCEYERWCM